MRRLTPLLLMALLSGAARAQAPTPAPAPAPTAAQPADAAPSPLAHLDSPGAYTLIRAQVVVRVADPEAAITAIVKDAVALGGYLSNREGAQLVVRVPTAKAGELLAHTTALGKVGERRYDVEDHATEIASLDAQIKSRREVIDRYFDLMSGADTSGVLVVERELSQLISQLEQITGRRRFLGHQLAYAEITVSFTFTERRQPETSATSSFPWINDMNLQDLLDSFRVPEGRR